MDYSLSILVCSYNRHFLLKECISNLIKIRRNVIPIEIIIIDDGSRKLIDENFKKYILLNDIIYKRNKKNKGLAFSRNRAINEASSKYISICDDDDFWKEPNKIKLIYEEMQRTNSDIGLGIPSANSNFKSTKYTTLQKIFKKGITPPVSYQIYKKDLVKDSNYNIKVKAGIDYDLWINLLSKNPNVVLISNCDIKTFKHKKNSSLTNSYDKRALNLINSRIIWEHKITEIYGSKFFLKFKKASIEYELWFRFLSNLSNLNFHGSIMVLYKYKNFIFFYRIYKYIGWKLFKIPLPINTNLFDFF
tara:strand:- start:7461 stop:8372 length:912 start_codon:yes stop_codon:yes gene_type:complete